MRPTLALALLIGCRNTEKPAEVDTGPLAEAPVDADGDGYDAGEDCDDNNSLVHPGADEVCDGADNDCSGEADEGVTTTFYADSDGDGFGDAAAAEASCEAPDGYVPVGTDCDDGNAAIYPGAAEQCDELDNDCDAQTDEDVAEAFYADADGDGYGDPVAVAEGCAPGAGYVADDSDCDDTDDAVYPGGTEVCDEADNDCDGTTDEDVGTTFYVDVDGDGFGLDDSTAQGCDPLTGYAEQGGDCDDGEAAINPAASEVCDGEDNDCDGEEDEGSAADTLTFFADSDGDSYGDAGDSARACEAPAGYVADDGDCDDGASDVYPGADETCDERDEDCDGDVDEEATDAPAWYGDADGDGSGGVTFVTYDCTQPGGYVASSDDCDDLDDAVFPGAAESCNGADDDCDGSVDEGLGLATYYADDDGDGYGDPADSAVDCAAPDDYVASSADCDDGDPAVKPGADEYCDGVDNDCDGAADEGAALDADIWFQDADGDGHGSLTSATACDQPAGYVALDDDCDDSQAGVKPGGTELCNGRDDDCDGTTDEDAAADADTWYYDGDGDGYGSGATAVACYEPSGYSDVSGDCNDGSAGVYPSAAESCNGVDDDCDGSVDDGVLGLGASCSAADCTEIQADNPSAGSGWYTLDIGTYYCDMGTYGGGWTRVKDNAYVYGTGYDGSYYNTEGFSWNEVLFRYDSGSIHAHCTYPSDLTGCNNLGFQFASESWGVPQNWGSSICGMATTSYTSATTYIGGYDFVISRYESTHTIRLGTLEGISSCTTGDNPGGAYLDIYVRR